MQVDLASSHRHYLDHLLPVWRALPADQRGTPYLAEHLRPLLPGADRLTNLAPSDNPVLIAGFDDLRRVDKRPVILMEHGIGQSYAGDPSAEIARNPAYAGGDGRHGVIAFLHPNEYAAARDRARYPDAAVHVIGSPRLAALQAIPAADDDTDLVVAVTFHFDLGLCPETTNAWRWLLPAVADLAARGVPVLGSAHPRLYRDAAPVYETLGIEPVERFEDLLSRAHVLVADNTSALYDWAAVRGPVVVANPPQYRRTVNHGLRFWDAANIGPQLSTPEALTAAINEALTTQPWPGADAILDQVFPPVENAAQVAADAAVAAATRSAGTPRRAAGRFPRVAP